jgi:hypothetical protein
LVLLVVDLLPLASFAGRQPATGLLPAAVGLLGNADLAKDVADGDATDHLMQHG